MTEEQSDPLEPTNWKCFTTALQFLTRIPVASATGQTAEYYATALRRGVVFFPFVGGLVGIFTATIFSVTLLIGLSPTVAALLTVGLECTLTGAFHEDAFADTWDALGGGWTREQVLEIMKDSRLGTYGTLGLVIGVGLRIAATSSLIPFGWLWALATIVAASALGRLAIVGMMVTTPPVADRESQARDISASQTWRTFLMAALLSSPCFATWLWINPLAAVTAIVISVAALYWFRGCILRRVGGTTGDLLGSCAFLVQLIVLVTSSGTHFHG